MMKALELITLLVDLVVLLQDDVTVLAYYHHVCNIFIGHRDRDFFESTIYSGEQIVRLSVQPIVLLRMLWVSKQM